MEFLEILLVLIALVLITFKPEREKLAFRLVVSSWVLMVIVYFGTKMGNIFPVINL